MNSRALVMAGIGLVIVLIVILAFTGCAIVTETVKCPPGHRTCWIN